MQTFIKFAFTVYYAYVPTVPTIWGVRMDGIYVCQICKEPINNFVNIDRLSSDISRWLPGSLSDRFMEFNAWFMGMFHCPIEIKHHHIVSHSRKSGNICLYCYINEVFQWLMLQDKTIARRFRRIFSFGMNTGDFREIIKSHAEPISEVVNVEDQFGVCDECGEYADELRLVNGRWICRECHGD